MEAQVEQGTEAKPEAPIAADALWDQAQKDRASTPADDAAPAQTAALETVDPLAGLPEPTRKLIEQIQAKTAEQDKALKDAGQKLATAHGTIGNLSKKLDDSLRTLTQMKPAVEAVQAEAKAKAEADAVEREAKRKERRDRLADMPDVLEELDDIRADAKPAEVKVDSKPEPKPETEPAEPFAEREARLIAERKLSDRHPKWIEVVRGKEFKDWEATQPEAVRALSASDDINDADKLLTLFKKHKDDAAAVAKVEADRQARLRRGENIQGTGTAQAGEKPSTDELWEKAKRDRAKARAA